MLHRAGSFLCWVAVVGVMTGCVTSSTPRLVQPQVRVVASPVGEARTAEIGEAIIENSQELSYDAIELKNRVTAGDGMVVKRITIPPGILRMTSQTDEDRYFVSDGATASDVLLGTIKTEAGLAVSKSGPTNIQVFAFGKLLYPSTTPQISTTTAKTIRGKREIIYNGRSGDVVKFVYREASEDGKSAARKEEFEYLLRNGSTVRFKGAQWEVLQASESKLEYRVARSFGE